MDAQLPATPFGEALRAALTKARRSQADLARALHTDPGQVSRWATGKSVPHAATVTRIEEVLGADLSDAFTASTPLHELYVSAPITGLDGNAMRRHHDAVVPVVEAARESVNGVFWPGENIHTPDDLVAPDIATERNLRILSSCEAFLYVQFDEIVQPTGALIELGLAMGQQRKTTIILRRGLKWPFMLNGLPSVAAGLPFLPKARLYEFDTTQQASVFISKNGRELLGLS